MGEEALLLGIVEGLKAFENILGGIDIIVFADHLKLLYPKNTLQIMERWWLILVEGFAPNKIRHIAGEDNAAVADCLLKMDMEHWEFNMI